MAWTPDYLTAEDAAEFVRAPGVDLAELAIWCTAASRAIDKRCNRQFGRTDALTTRTYRRPAVYDAVSALWLLETDDVHDPTGLTVNGQPYADAGAVLLPDDAPDSGRPYERLGFTDCPDAPVAVATSGWGWTAVPTQVSAAARLQVSRWSTRRDSPYGIAGSPEAGSEMRLLARLDPDVSTTLAGLARRRRVG
ncbi:hypothetical protein [Salinispora vitiensis]|uniref:hypothetical protein n=1 Tax=Salinispora vitiensis TaxID=999544 RepID=UPI000365CD35|nr:hypothetical protein [Salinispora vitiensis]